MDEVKILCVLSHVRPVFKRVKEDPKRNVFSVLKKISTFLFFKIVVSFQSESFFKLKGPLSLGFIRFKDSSLEQLKRKLAKRKLNVTLVSIHQGFIGACSL